MSDEQPNILFILSDQHAQKVSGCYGDPVIRTPNLDALAAQGVRFTNAYTPSPICVPARMSLLTGQYPHRQQCWTNSDALPSDIPTTAHALGAVGYRPTLIGRLHAIGPDQMHGFARREIGDHISDWYGGEPYSMGVLDKAQRPYKESLINSGPGQNSYELLDRAVTDKTLAELDGIATARDRGERKPFCLHVGYMLPHQPYVADPDLYASYAGKVGPPVLPPLEHDENSYLSWWRQQTGLTQISEADELRARTAYYALVETLDREIGKVLDRLEQLQLTDNTLIIYASDHGEQLGERGLWWKQTFYDESAKVPLIMKWAGRIASNETRSEIINLVDLSATLVDAGGSPALPGIDGRSLLNLAAPAAAARPDERVVQVSDSAGNAERETWGTETYSEYCTDGLAAWAGGRVLQSRMIRSGHWKLNYYHGSRHQLFDLKSDPQETHNLIDEPACYPQRDELQAKILSSWNPEAIADTMARRQPQKHLLKAWAQSVKPPEKFKWPTRPEDNWLT